MNNTDSIRTIKIEISELLSDEQKHDIDITIEDAFKVSELFTKLGIEHKSTSYMTMHKYGYDVAKQMCPNLNTTLLQQMNLNNAMFRTPLLLSFFSING